MKPPTPKWRWQVEPVDRAREHIELRVALDKAVSQNEWTIVALVAPPISQVFSVEFLLSEAEPGNRELLDKVRSQLQFYLIDKQEANPWAYARYHCGTASNIYSEVHWSWHKPPHRMSADR
jgi:hypothetical protein